ncbi:MAG TPA: enoyl-CoA hydratase-related protein [Longimicrobiales bacterium]|nr:enoyl-CoA hydratase-related protein [Longimicrobiales bacterium]
MSVLYDVADGIATLTLNRPEKRNALDDPTIAALKEHFGKADADGDVRVIVLRGEGTDFCAGGDLSQLEKIASSAAREENLADAMNLGELFIQMRRLKKPIIAAVRGNALAGGAGLASACDVVIAEDGATFGYPEVKLGFVPAMVMAMLTRIIGEKKSFELAALGNSISAREAHRIGLVNRITSSANFPDDVQALAKELAQRSSSAVQLIKGLVYGLEGRSFESAIRYGAEINVEARATPDCQTGVRRFLESRKKQ